MDSREYETQLCAIESILKERPMTMLQASRRTGILRANICRHVRTLRMGKRIAVVKRERCPISRYRANFYTTDPAHFPNKTQTELPL